MRNLCQIHYIMQVEMHALYKIKLLQKKVSKISYEIKSFNNKNIQNNCIPIAYL